MGSTVQEESVIWSPNPGPQTALLSCPIGEIFYGGARGGGKTDGALGFWLNHADQWPKYARGLLFRRTYPELEEVEARAAEIFPLAGYRYAKRRWVHPYGANIRLRAMMRDADAAKYMGNSISCLLIDEAPNWSSAKPLNKLRAILRSPYGVRCCLVLTGNPGGLLHNYFKGRYVDPAPPYTPIFDPVTNSYRVFIPSLLEDTPQFSINDPEYRNRIIASAAGDQALLKAWLEGEWNLPFGGMFDDLWDLKHHVIEPFSVPSSWYVDRSFDWGSSAPFSVGWWAESNGEQAPNGITYPKGWLFRIAEWYGWNNNPDDVKGCLMLARDVAKGIKEREKKMGLKVRPGPADPSIWNENQQGQSIAGDMLKEGVNWLRGDNARVHGWEQFRKRLTAAREFPEDPQPGISIFDTCRQFIRTIPNLPRDPDHRDDVDTDAEDHIADEARYKLATKRGRFGVSEVLI